jgi:small-conductance mechanosensitive channel
MLRLIYSLLMLVALALPPTEAMSQSAGPGKPAGKEVAPPSATQAPVTLDGKTLFMVRERIFSFSPADRAGAISGKLDKLLKDPLVTAEAIATVDAEAVTDIVAGDMIIMSVTDKDAMAEGRTRQDAAKEYARQIRGAIEQHHREYSLDSITRGALYAALVTALLIALLLLFRRAFPRFYAKIDSWRGTRIRSIKIQSFEIMHADRIAAMLIGAARGGRVLITVLLFYFYIPLVFSFFPGTRGFSARLFNYITTPLATIGNAAISYLPNIFFIAVIVVVTQFVIKFSRLFFSEVAKGAIALPGFYTEWAEPTYKIVRFLIIAFAAIVAFPYVPGSDSPAFKGVSIFFGVLFSLGSSSAVSNIVAGVILTYTRGFKIGDRVKIADTMGDVTEKTLLVTRVRSIKNVDVTIPNSLVLTSHVTNFSSSAKEYGLILHTSVTIGYDAPWRKVHELLLAAAGATEHVLELPAPFVLQTALDDFYVTYELNVYTDYPQEMVRIYSELHQNIQDKFNESGVEIMSPHYSQLRDGNKTTIPESYLPEGYAPPAFRVFQSAEQARQGSGGKKPDSDGL